MEKGEPPDGTPNSLGNKKHYGRHSIFFHFLSCSLMFAHVLSCSFMFFHVLSCSFHVPFMFFHFPFIFLSCSFIFLHVLSCSFMFFFSFIFCHFLSLFFPFFVFFLCSFFLGCSKSFFLPRLPCLINFVPISLDNSYVKNQIFGPSRGGLGFFPPLGYFFSCLFFPFFSFSFSFSISFHVFFRFFPSFFLHFPSVFLKRKSLPLSFCFPFFFSRVPKICGGTPGFLGGKVHILSCFNCFVLARRHFSLWNSAHSGGDQIESLFWWAAGGSSPTFVPESPDQCLNETADAPQSGLSSLLSSLSSSLSVSVSVLCCVVCCFSVVLCCGRVVVVLCCVVSCRVVSCCVVLCCVVLCCVVLCCGCVVVVCGCVWCGVVVWWCVTR